MLSIEKKIALVAIMFRLVSPGLFVKTYLQKFNDTKTWKINIKKINGSCFSIPLNIIIMKEMIKVTNIIPTISDRPATAWLKKPKLSKANSSVNIKSWIA